MRKHYIAYGSNLNIKQMKLRCPDAFIVGKTKLEGWRLLFKGSKTGAYLTIEEAEGYEVPVVVWSVTEDDEIALDRYEGYPNFYYKKTLPVELKGIKTGADRSGEAFAYIMHEERPLGIPSHLYLATCLDGYSSFGFDKRILMRAYNDSMPFERRIFHGTAF